MAEQNQNQNPEQINSFLTELALSFELQGIPQSRENAQQMLDLVYKLGFSIDDLLRKYGSQRRAVDILTRQYQKWGSTGIKAATRMGKSINLLTYDFLGLKSSVETVARSLRRMVVPDSVQDAAKDALNYNKTLLRLSATTNRLGIGINGLDIGIRKAGRASLLTRQETFKLFDSFQEGMKIVNLGSFENMLVRIKSMVGANTEAMDEYQRSIIGVSQRYPELGQQLTNIERADKRALDARIRSLYLIGEIGEAEYRRLSAYISGNQQITKSERDRQKKIQAQIDTIQRVKKQWEEVSISVGNILLPILEKVNSILKAIDNSGDGVKKTAIAAATAFVGMAASLKIGRGIFNVAGRMKGPKVGGFPVNGMGKRSGGVLASISRGLLGVGSGQAQKVEVVNFPPGLDGLNSPSSNIPENVPKGMSGIKKFGHFLTGDAFQAGKVGGLSRLGRFAKSPAAIIAQFAGAFGLGKLEEKYREQKDEKKAAAAGLGRSVLEIGGSAASGAMLGSMILPGVGTAVGAVVGGAAAAIKDWDSVSDSVKILFADKAPSWIKDAFSGVSSTFKNLYTDAQKMLGLKTKDEKQVEVKSDFDKRMKENREKRSIDVAIQTVIDQQLEIDYSQGSSFDFSKLASQYEKAMNNFEKAKEDSDGKLIDSIKGMNLSKEVIDAMSSGKTATDKVTKMLASQSDLIAEMETIRDGMKEEGKDVSSINEQIESQKKIKEIVEDQRAAQIESNESLKIATQEYKLQEARVEQATRIAERYKEVVQGLSEYARSQSQYMGSLFEKMSILGDIDMSQVQKAIDDSLNSVEAETAALTKQKDILQSTQALIKGTGKEGASVEELMQAKGLSPVLKDHLNTLVEQGVKYLDIVKVQKDIKNIEGEIEQKTKKRTDVLLQVKNIMQDTLQATSLQAQKSDLMIQLADNYAMGVKASAEMRYKAYQAQGLYIKDLKQTLKLQRNAVQENIRQGGSEKENLRLRNAVRETEIEILNAQIKQASQVKGLRDAWVSAISAMNTGSDTMTEILMDAETNTAQIHKLAGAVRSAASGALALRDAFGNIIEDVGYQTAEVMDQFGEISSASGRTGFELSYNTPTTQDLGIDYRGPELKQKFMMEGNFEELGEDISSQAKKAAEAGMSALGATGNQYILSSVAGAGKVFGDDISKASKRASKEFEGMGTDFSSDLTVKDNRKADQGTKDAKEFVREFSSKYGDVLPVYVVNFKESSSSQISKIEDRKKIVDDSVSMGKEMPKSNFVEEDVIKTLKMEQEIVNSHEYKLQILGEQKKALENQLKITVENNLPQQQVLKIKADMRGVDEEILRTQKITLGALEDNLSAQKKALSLNVKNKGPEGINLQYKDVIRETEIRIEKIKEESIIGNSASPSINGEVMGLSSTSNISTSSTADLQTSLDINKQILSMQKEALRLSKERINSESEQKQLSKSISVTEEEILKIKNKLNGIEYSSDMTIDVNYENIDSLINKYKKGIVVNGKFVFDDTAEKEMADYKDSEFLIKGKAILEEKDFDAKLEKLDKYFNIHGEADIDFRDTLRKLKAIPKYKDILLKINIEGDDRFKDFTPSEKSFLTKAKIVLDSKDANTQLGNLKKNFDIEAGVSVDVKDFNNFVKDLSRASAILDKDNFTIRGKKIFEEIKDADKTSDMGTEIIVKGKAVLEEGDLDKQLAKLDKYFNIQGEININDVLKAIEKIPNYEHVFFNVDVNDEMLKSLDKKDKDFIIKAQVELADDDLRKKTDILNKQIKNKIKLDDKLFDIDKNFSIDGSADVDTKSVINKLKKIPNYEKIFFDIDINDKRLKDLTDSEKSFVVNARVLLDAKDANRQLDTLRNKVDIKGEISLSQRLVDFRNNFDIQAQADININSVLDKLKKIPNYKTIFFNSNVDFDNSQLKEFTNEEKSFITHAKVLLNTDDVYKQLNILNSDFVVDGKVKIEDYDLPKNKDISVGLGFEVDSSNLHKQIQNIKSHEESISISIRSEQSRFDQLNTANERLRGAGFYGAKQKSPEEKRKSYERGAELSKEVNIINEQLKPVVERDKKTPEVAEKITMEKKVVYLPSDDSIYKKEKQLEKIQQKPEYKYFQARENRAKAISEYTGNKKDYSEKLNQRIMNEIEIKQGFRDEKGVARDALGIKEFQNSGREAHIDAENLIKEINRMKEEQRKILNDRKQEISNNKDYQVYNISNELKSLGTNIVGLGGEINNSERRISSLQQSLEHLQSQEDELQKSYEKYSQTSPYSEAIEIKDVDKIASNEQSYREAISALNMSLNRLASSLGATALQADSQAYISEMSKPSKLIDTEAMQKSITDSFKRYLIDAVSAKSEKERANIFSSAKKNAKTQEEVEKISKEELTIEVIGDISRENPRMSMNEVIGEASKRMGMAVEGISYLGDIVGQIRQLDNSRSTNAIIKAMNRVDQKREVIDYGALQNILVKSQQERDSRKEGMQMRSERQNKNKKYMDEWRTQQEGWLSWMTSTESPRQDIASSGEISSIKAANEIRDQLKVDVEAFVGTINDPELKKAMSGFLNGFIKSGKTMEEFSKTNPQYEALYEEMSKTINSISGLSGGISNQSIKNETFEASSRALLKDIKEKSYNPQTETNLQIASKGVGKDFEFNKEAIKAISKIDINAGSEANQIAGLLDAVSNQEKSVINYLNKFKDGFRMPESKQGRKEVVDDIYDFLNKNSKTGNTRFESLNDALYNFAEQVNKAKPGQDVSGIAQTAQKETEKAAVQQRSANQEQYKILVVEQRQINDYKKNLETKKKLEETRGVVEKNVISEKQMTVISENRGESGTPDWNDSLKEFLPKAFSPWETFLSSMSKTFMGVSPSIDKGMQEYIAKQKEIRAKEASPFIEEAAKVIDFNNLNIEELPEKFINIKKLWDDSISSLEDAGVSIKRGAIAVDDKFKGLNQQEKFEYVETLLNNATKALGGVAIESQKASSKYDVTKVVAYRNREIEQLEESQNKYQNRVKSIQQVLDSKQLRGKQISDSQRDTLQKSLNYNQKKEKEYSEKIKYIKDMDVIDYSEKEYSKSPEAKKEDSLKRTSELDRKREESNRLKQATSEWIKFNNSTQATGDIYWKEEKRRAVGSGNLTEIREVEKKQSEWRDKNKEVKGLYGDVEKTTGMKIPEIMVKTGLSANELQSILGTFKEQAPEKIATFIEKGKEKGDYDWQKFINQEKETKKKAEQTNGVPVSKAGIMGKEGQSSTATRQEVLPQNITAEAENINKSISTPLEMVSGKGAGAIEAAPMPSNNVNNLILPAANISVVIQNMSEFASAVAKKLENAFSQSIVQANDEANRKAYD